MRPTATIYARQSLDRKGDQEAVERQLALCREECARRGWEVAAELVDNDRSATSGVERPSFEALLASRPERIVVWHLDRLVRLTPDLERVIQLGVDVHAVKAGHLDLSNPAGRAVARTVTAWAQYEGEQKALRQRAANDQRASAGRPFPGRRCFGYTADGTELVEAEAEATRWAVQALLSGVPLRGVVRQLGADGVVTTAGNPWTATNFRNYLRRPRLAALRVHRGEVVGPGSWPPIISVEDHTAVVALLADPARKPVGRPRTYLLSGVARCGQCGGRLYGRSERRGPIYVCESAAHLGRKLGDIDSYVEAVVVGRLARPDAAELFTRPGDRARADQLRAEQTTITRRLDELAEAFAAGAITARQLTTATSTLTARADELAAELPTVTGEPVLQTVITAEDVAEAWAALDTEVRREVIDRLLVVTVHPAGRGARHFDPSTVELTWR